MALDEPKEEQETVQINTLEVVLDEMVKPFASGQVVDFVEEGSRRGFVIAAQGSAC